MVLKHQRQNQHLLLEIICKMSILPFILGILNGKNTHRIFWDNQYVDHFSPLQHESQDHE